MHCELPQCITIVCLQPVAALVVIYLAVMTLQTQSTAPTVAGCCLVGCSVVSGLPLRSRVVTGVSQHVCVCLGPVLASHAPSPPAAAAATWRRRGQIPIAGWGLGGAGPERGLWGGGRRGFRGAANALCTAELCVTEDEQGKWTLERKRQVHANHVISNKNKVYPKQSFVQQKFLW